MEILADSATVGNNQVNPPTNTPARTRAQKLNPKPCSKMVVILDLIAAYGAEVLESQTLEEEASVTPP